MAQQNPGGLEAYTAPSRIVVIIDPDPRLRDSLARALVNIYRVADHPDIQAAIGRTSTPPAAALIGARTPDCGRVSAIAALRGQHAFRDVPLVLCKPSGMPSESSAEADAVLALPCQDAVVRSLVGRLGNKAVEKGWDQLSPTPREALKRALAMFSDLPRIMGAGSQLDYADITETCTPVINVVKSSTHAEVFAGLRNHNDFNYVHSLRVSTLLALFGFTIGLDEASLLTLAAAGLLHDIGKTLVPAKVMGKATPLTPRELEQAHGHVTATVDYLEQHSDVPKAVITIAGQHHERLDGSGYPNRLDGSEINDLSRMAAIVDVFCALTERRPHRAAMPPMQALEIMQETLAGKLDQSLTRMFSGMLLRAAD